jgi:16S rRNA (cytosine1402-N4)-methyltransferase
VNCPAVEHIPVLAETLTEQIRLPRDGVMVDATIGHGGHSLLFGAQLGPEAVLVGLDVDKKSLRRAQSSLEHLPCRVICIHSNFADITQALHEQGIEKADFILADLGLSSSQLADPCFGLSFNTDMPLDMRMDERITTTAADIVNGTDEKSLADLIYKFGQDRASRRIARFIVTQRRKKKITTTGELAAIVARALARPGKRFKGRIHPATRTFQALRIAVNNELKSLEKLLDSAPTLLKKDGYIAVISFHSLEDRLVKNNFRQNEKDGLYKILTKKPLVPTRDEIAANRRSRSAKLRIAQRT